MTSAQALPCTSCARRYGVSGPSLLPPPRFAALPRRRVGGGGSGGSSSVPFSFSTHALLVLRSPPLWRAPRFGRPPARRRLRAWRGVDSGGMAVVSPAGDRLTQCPTERVKADVVPVPELLLAASPTPIHQVRETKSPQKKKNGRRDKQPVFEEDWDQLSPVLNIVHGTNPRLNFHKIDVFSRLSRADLSGITSSW